MTRTLAALLTAATVATAGIATPTPADARGGRIAAGVIGGLAAGAIIGGALAAPYYYGGGPNVYGGGPYVYGDGPYVYGDAPYYAAAPYPAYGYGNGCWQRERFWTGYGWAVRRVRIC
jgi:hypothetical protein